MKFVVPLLSLLGTVLSAPASSPESRTLEDRAANVKVSLPAASGTVTGRSLLGVESFNGIPFADPPVGPLRLKPPQKLSTALGDFDGTGIAPSCPQMFLSEEALGGIGKIANDVLQIPLLQKISGVEDCLTVTVQRPAGTKKGDKLPVLFWIFGGGFELGSTITYDAGSLLTQAVLQGQPFVYVAVNYRVAGFGFMPGSEILKDGSANLGLLDQRMGMQWAADNVAEFGGDPDRITLWGESAGSISVFNQMALYDGDVNYKGKPLFRGAIMDSGSVVPADPVDCPKGQQVYDSVVAAGGCSGASDTLNCLRELDYNTFLDAVNSVPGIVGYNSVALSYLPRPDGKILTASPDLLASGGKYHAVPMIIGDQEDEGTLFALFQTNLTTTDDIIDYFQDLYFHSATRDQIAEVVNTYNASAADGSPFRTGSANQLYPAFKTLAALLGDLTFTLTRRAFLKSTLAANPNTPSWSYLSSYDYGTPILGTFHATDILQVFYGILPNHAMTSSRTYYFNFLYNLDPNKGFGGYGKWPQWKDGNQLMWFKNAFSNDLLKDDFRSQSFDAIWKNTRNFYI